MAVRMWPADVGFISASGERGHPPASETLPSCRLGAVGFSGEPACRAGSSPNDLASLQGLLGDQMPVIGPPVVTCSAIEIASGHRGPSSATPALDPRSQCGDPGPVSGTF